MEENQEPGMLLTPDGKLIDGAFVTKNIYNFFRMSDMEQRVFLSMIKSKDIEKKAIAYIKNHPEP